MKSYLKNLLINQISGISINTDLFETNIINIILLQIILFILIQNYFSNNLLKRKQRIAENIETAQIRLLQTSMRYRESKKQLEEIDILIKDINKQLKERKEHLLRIEWFKVKSDLSKKFTALIITLDNKKVQIRNQIIKDIKIRLKESILLKMDLLLDQKDHSAIVTRKLKHLRVKK
uniref:CF0 subunit I n=1 Tax=Phaeophyceae sp. TaxID=2249243 RepID=A0A8E5BF62_9PHAE|nr:CF0 subunit I [Phaeophyceae sp.]